MIWVVLGFMGGVIFGLVAAFAGIAWVGHVFARTTVTGS